MLHDWQARFAGHLRRHPSDMVATDGSFLGGQAHRFSVYRDNVLGSLVDALGQTFPVVRQLLGVRFFDAVAADFVRDNPPSAPRLSRYGEDFPNLLRAMPQLAELAYIADVADLEWARVEAYFAGVTIETLSAEALLSQPSDTLPHLIFVAAPSLRVVSMPTAGHSIWLAHQSAEPDLGAMDPWQGEAVRLICQPPGVLAERLSPAQAAFLSALLAGQDLTTAATATLDMDGAFDLQAALAAELSAGSFIGIAPAPAGAITR